MLRVRVLLASLLIAAALAACGGRTQSASSTSASPVPFSQQLAVFEQSKFRARYDVETSTQGSKGSQTAKSTWHVTWYRNGSARQRFDMSGKDFDGQQWDLTVFVRGSDLIVCGTNPDEGGKGACGVDPETALTFLESLGFDSLLRPWNQDALRSVISSGGAPETISRQRASCYSVRFSQVVPAVGDPADILDICFAPAGAPVKRTVLSSTFSTAFTLTGGISAPEDKDFELPYDLAPTPSTTP